MRTSATQQPGKKLDIKSLISCAMGQFREWCHAFRDAVSEQSTRKVTIRLFAGDALQFCRTLHHCALTSSTTASLYLSPWALEEVVLDGGDYGPEQAPTTFDVIDTSNIMDHVGLLNLLIVVTPLLSHRSSSILYTEALLVKGKDAQRSFVQRLCASIPAMSLLIGIAPLAYLSEFTTHSNTHELMASTFFDGRQYHERVAWKIPYLGDAVAVSQHQCRIHPSWDPSQLARLLFDVYYHMFIDEDTAQKLKNLATHSLGDSIMHYHRSTFVAFLALVKSRTDTDWTPVMESIFDHLHTDRRLILGTNGYQELCCQLHVQNVYSIEMFQPGGGIPINRSIGKFRGWLQVPPVICVVLKVPRSKLKILEDMSSDKIGSPMLDCHIYGPASGDNFFSTIQFSFGTFSTSGAGCETRGVIEEDATGWSGMSSLIVSFWVPSHILVAKPPSSIVNVSLAVHPTPAAAIALSRQLGLRLTLHSASLTDDSVCVLTERPLRINAVPPPSVSSHVASVHSEQKVFVALSQLQAITMAMKWNDVEVSQLDTPKAEQVIVPLFEPYGSGGFSTARFPMLLSNVGSPATWNVHTVHLDNLPVMSQQAAKSEWIRTHLLLSLSDRERRLQNTGTEQTKGPLLDMKESILSIFQDLIEKDGPRIFGLQALETGIYTIIFFNKFCHDLASNTILADCVVLPLSPEGLDVYGQHLANKTLNGQMNIIPTLPAETLLWKHILPVLTERCRTWSHKPTCDYQRAGKIPISTDLECISLCSCGAGHDLGSFNEVPAWKAFAPYATRAVISPLFAVSYIEEVTGVLKDFKNGASGRSSAQVSENTAHPSPHLCAQCGAGAAVGKALLLCSRCKGVRYCGKVFANSLIVMAPLSLLVTALAAISTQAYEIRERAPITSDALTTEVLPQAQFTMPFSGRIARSKSKQEALRSARNRSSSYTTVLAGGLSDQEYLTDISIGGQDFKVLVDTGSSNTWLAEKDFKCTNLTGYLEPQSTCAFGPLYDPKSSTTYTPDPNQNFKISYGDGAHLTGTVAFETITVGGMTVKRQEMGVVNNAAWEGDTVSSGLIGLAYPGATSVYNGTNPNKDGPANYAPYNPLFNTALAEGVIKKPYFSVALNRGASPANENSTYDPNMGYLAFGGIAPLNTTGNAVTVPVRRTNFSPAGNKTDYYFYTVDIDSYIFPGSNATGLGLTGSGKQAILDTGTTVNWVPTELAKAYNAQFEPPATYDEDQGYYFVQCNATVPEFDVVIGGKTFTIDARDQILRWLWNTNESGEELCISGTQDGGDPSDPTTIYIMGGVFLHNVVTTFNVKNNVVTVTQREAY
ncbi:hypothetical protein HWV62_19417 [Athelia sp. TMB]|nr:hypothetical protein HWV62_19417 [Athelia sp. TMB]